MKYSCVHTAVDLDLAFIDSTLHIWRALRYARRKAGIVTSSKVSVFFRNKIYPQNTPPKPRKLDSCLTTYLRAARSL